MGPKMLIIKQKAKFVNIFNNRIVEAKALFDRLLLHLTKHDKHDQHFITLFSLPDGIYSLCCLDRTINVWH